MKRVVHVVSSLEIGGAERLVVDLACAQQRAGLGAWIVDLGRDESPLADAARRLGVQVIRAGRMRSRLARTVWLARVLVARENAIHIHNPWALRAVLPILPAIRGRVIYTRHGASPYGGRGWRAVHRLARPFIDQITFVTDEARAAFEAAHWRSVFHHIVIENGVAVPAAVPDRERPGRLRIGSVGRLVELKGQRLVLDAIAALPPDHRARVEVHLFGDGPDRSSLTDHARASLHDVPVVFHGTVLDRERIYNAIDVLAVGSRTEGQSLAIMEAMARGVPAIATNVGGNPQFVHDGETGMLVPSGDATAIRDAIARMLVDPDLVSRLGRASHSLIGAYHSIDAVAARYHSLYSRRS
ncbi:MAG TPA: glycosyltransferase family 4 protein [Kofleriaceae bacterium]|nr:glycosyltransferase family 4 protein [Kofleriaceae bacterium]